MLEALRQGIIKRFHRFSKGQGRPFNHNDRYFQLACSRDLAVTCRAAAIFGYDAFNAVFHKQLSLAVFFKRAAIQNILDIRNIQRWLDRVDTSHNVMMPRSFLEREKLLASKSNKYFSGKSVQSRNRSFDIRNILPKIIRQRLPGRTAEGDQPCSRLFCRICRMMRHGGGIRMGGINEKINLLLFQISGQSVNAPESANPYRNRLFQRIFGSACKRQDNIKILSLPAFSLKSCSKLAGFKSAAKYQNMVCHD